jgi:hypothetical protein
MDPRERDEGGMDCLHEVQDRYQCQALLNLVMILQVPKSVGKC